MSNVKSKLFLFILSVLTISFISVGSAWAWTETSPEDHGFSEDALENAAAQIGAVETRYGVVFVQGSEIIHEKYFRGDKDTKHNAYSVTKSFSGALLGAAISIEALGISVDDQIEDYTDVPWRMDGEAAIEHVLSQTSQKDFLAGDPPGTNFVYQAGDYTLILPTLSKVINAALSDAGGEFAGMTTSTFKDEYIFNPLGLVNTEWPESDNSGNLKIAAGINTTCRDMAKLGLLYLNKGKWCEDQDGNPQACEKDNNGDPIGPVIIAQEYIEDSTTPPFPDANAAYGYLWWLNPSGDQEWVRPKSTGTTGTGAMVKGAPDNVYFAIGFYGQLIIVIPGYDMVVTTMGYTDVTDTLETLQKVWNAINCNLNLYNIDPGQCSEG